MMWLEIVPLEPLHVGRRQLAGPDLTAPDEATAVIPPATVLGALGALKNVQLTCCDDAGLVPLCELAGKLVGHRGEHREQGRECKLAEGVPVEGCPPGPTCTEAPLLWGPFYRVGDGLYIPLEDGLRLLPLASAGEYVGRAVAEFRGEAEGEASFPVLRMEAKDRVGLALERPSKTAKRGFLYRPAYVHYVAEGRRVTVLYRPHSGLQLPELPATARVGGEGRLAELHRVDERIEQSGSRIAVVLSPLLFYADGYAQVGVSPGLECLEEVYGLWTGREFKVRVVRWGLGFSEACRRRRPMWHALPPGTVVRLKEECGRKAAVGLFSWLGYGSLYRP